MKHSDDLNDGDLALRAELTAELAVLGRLLDRQVLDALHDRRAVVFSELGALGYSREELAALNGGLTGFTFHGVDWALGRHNRRQTPPAAEALLAVTEIVEALRAAGQGGPAA